MAGQLPAACCGNVNLQLGEKKFDSGNIHGNCRNCRHQHIITSSARASAARTCPRRVEISRACTSTFCLSRAISAVRDALEARASASALPSPAVQQPRSRHRASGQGGYWEAGSIAPYTTYPGSPHRQPHVDPENAWTLPTCREGEHSARGARHPTFTLDGEPTHAHGRPRRRHTVSSDRRSRLDIMSSSAATSSPDGGSSWDRPLKPDAAGSVLRSSRSVPAARRRWWPYLRRDTQHASTRAL